MTFEQLNICEPILRALKEKGYETPTAIQKKAIPEVLDRRDLYGLAQTGTGKTAAFAVPIIQLIHKIEAQKGGDTVLRALIVTPTRELAIQIDDNIKEYSKYTDVNHTVIFGGVKQHEQVRNLKKGVHILVATPGRLLDLVGQGIVSLDTVKLFVLDEADRMLDMGFIHDIRKMLELLPEKRQSLFFSATMPTNIVKLSKTILTDPVRVEAQRTSSAAETVQQFVYYTNKSSKRDLLKHVLDDPEMDQVLLFSRTKHGADKIARNLTKSKIPAAAIHGNKQQNQRQKVLKQFKDGKIRVLVATDIAARGIDIKQLKYVINYDVPNVAETYVHRIGRSGRAGEEGVAISLCEPEENSYVRGIEKLIKQKLRVVENNPFPQTDKPMTEEEKKEWEKEKSRRRQEFFANRKKTRTENGSFSRPSRDKKSKPSRGNSKPSGSGKTREKELAASEAGGGRRKSKSSGPKSSDNRGPKRKQNNQRRRPKRAAFPERGRLGDFPLLD